MSSNGSSQGHARGTGHPRAKQKLARRQQLKEDQKRSELLARILEVSSSSKLNERTSQWTARQAIEDHALLFDLIDELRTIESRFNPELPTRDERSWSKFIKWYSSEELKLGKEAIFDEPAKDDSVRQIRLFDRCGIRRQPVTNALDSNNSEEYSLVAKVPFKKDDRVFEIDRGLMLTTETAMKDPDLNDFIKKDSIASGMPNVVLVMHLLNEYCKGERSRWWPYLSILPNRILPILQMSKRQMSTYLLASANLYSALKMLRAITRQYSYFYKRLQSTTLPIRYKFTLLLYTWGVSVVCSRQNEIPPTINCGNDSKNKDPNQIDEGVNTEQLHHERHQLKSVHALIPVLDMCNHDPKSNQATFENNASCLEAKADLSSNQEITLNYGFRSSGDFFIHNGFVPDEVPYDSVGFILTLSQRQDFLSEKRAKILEAFGIATTCGEFTLRSKDFSGIHRCDPPLTTFLIANFLEDEELAIITDNSDSDLLVDELYRRVRQECASWLTPSQNGVHEPGQEPGHDNVNGNTNQETNLLNKIVRRLRACIKEYLSRRASVSIALIDRSLKNLAEPSTDFVGDQANSEIKFYITRLLEREKKVYEDNLIK